MRPIALVVVAQFGLSITPGDRRDGFYAREVERGLLSNQMPGGRSFSDVRGRRIAPGDAAVWPVDLPMTERTLGLAGLYRLAMIS